MDELKKIVITSLEQEGTLSALKAHLRSRVFQAIEQNADQQVKTKAGFQWQNPNVEAIHNSDDALVGAHIIRDYFDHYKMDYTQSVYLPEVAIHHAAKSQTLTDKSRIAKEASIVEGENKKECLMVQMMRQLKQQQSEIESLKSELA